ncbi:MAG: hypothetical protein NXH87_07015 [Rhodobiaceae bacterium]|nr:hypothetical protein [Rhodobiaceae bacterium]
MAQIVINSILVVFGLFFAYTAVASFRTPVSFARGLGLEPNGRSGAIEIRAQYGGFFAAAGIAQFAVFGGVISAPAALFVGLVIFGGLIAGRGAAFLIGDKGEKLLPIISALYWIDGVGCIAAVIGLFLAS